MKDEVKEILNELKTSDGIEMLKLDFEEMTDYRRVGYYVLVKHRKNRNSSIGLCYLSKDKDILVKKRKNMKNPDDYLIMNRLRKG